MRLRDVGDSHHQLLLQLARRVSRRLEAQFIDLTGSSDTSIGIQLRERGHQTVVELPERLLLGARDDLSTREILRLRLKAGRDRMFFREDIPLGGQAGGVSPSASPSSGGGGYRRGGR